MELNNNPILKHEKGLCEPALTKERQGERSDACPP
jgi:hypothetical protein